MNVVDIIILIFIGFGFLLGFKRGFTRELVSLLGIFVILVLSFILKNPVSVFLYSNLPFFNFGGVFKDVTVINILVYEIIAFFSVFFVLSIIFRLLLSLTKIFEKVLSATIILGIPSKILGGVLGIIQTIIYSFFVLYILNMPTINMSEVKESKIGNIIIEKTPVLKNVADSTLKIFNDVVELKNEYESSTNMDEYNKRVLNIMIENNVITKENAQKLIDKGKIKNITL